MLFVRAETRRGKDLVGIEIYWVELHALDFLYNEKTKCYTGYYLASAEILSSLIL